MVIFFNVKALSVTPFSNQINVKPSTSTKNFNVIKKRYNFRNEKKKQFMFRYLLLLFFH